MARAAEQQAGERFPALARVRAVVTDARVHVETRNTTSLALDTANGTAEPAG